METLSCSHVLHLMKPRKAYLSKECLTGDHDIIYLIEDPNSTTEYNIGSITNGRNIAIRCRSEEIIKYRAQIKENPKLQNYEIYQCITSSKNEELILVNGKKSLLRDFFVDQDGEAVYVLEDHPLPVVGHRLKCNLPNYIPRFLRGAVVSKSLFDAETKGVCFFSGNLSYLEENIRKYLVEMPEEIKFDKRNVFIKVRDDDVDKYWRKASNLKCPLLHIRVEGADMELRRYKNWTSVGDNIFYSERMVPEENILTDISDGITILTGEPGIGKSYLLRSLLKNYGMEKYILFYNLADYGRSLTKEKLVPTNSSLDFLLDRSKNKRYEEFLSALLKIKDRLLVLLDSFDEVLPTYKDNVLRFIRNLAASKVQIIIASRIIGNHILMDNFEAGILKVDLLGANDCKKYTKNCKISDEVLAAMPNECSQNPLYLNLLKIISENNVNLKCFNKLSLFQSVIEIKMEQYFQRYFSEHISNKEYHLAPVRELHFQLALMRILGVDVVNRLLKLENKNELTNELKLGIVLSVDERGHPFFVHETFAEYLAADWIIRNKTKDSAKNIYLEMLKQEKLCVLDILCEHLKLHKAVLQNNKKEIKRYASYRSHLEETDDLGRMAIHVAATHQSNAFWFAIDIIIRNMCKFQVKFTHTDVIMQWNWVEHLYRTDVLNLKVLDIISTPVREAYLTCIAQKLRINREVPINLVSNNQITKICLEAIKRDNIHMIRDLLFIEDAKFNGVSQALKVDTLHSRNIRKLTASHVGCIYGNMKLIEKSIKRKYMNAKDSFGCTPLNHGVMTTEVCVDMTKMLLRNGSKIDIVNNNAETAIHIAVCSGNVDVARLLLQKAAYMSSLRINLQTFLFLAFDRNDQNMIELLLEHQMDADHISSGLIYATTKGNWEIVPLLLEKGANVNKADTNGKTPLMIASEKGTLNIVKLLLEEGAKVSSATTKGKTPLMFASERGNSDILKVLLEGGADINSRTKDDKTPLIFASERGNSNVVKMLLERGANVNSRTRDDKTPLMFASEKGNLDIVKLLLNQGAHVFRKTAKGTTPLMFASEKGDLDIVKLLLQEGAKVSSTTGDGETPLMFASARGNPDIVRMLLKRGSNVNITDTHGKTPLMFASEKGNLDTVKLLLEQGANVSHTTADGRTPLMFASTSDSSDVAKMLLERGADVNSKTTDGKTSLMFAAEGATADVVKLLLKNGSNINSKTTEGITPLMFASIRGNLDIAKMLLEKGADINSITMDGRTPLIFASAWGSSHVARLLLEKGSNANSSTTNGETPLMFGSRSNKLDIVEILLDYGANVNSTTTDGKTPLIVAAEYAGTDIVELLLKRGANISNVTNDGKTAIMFAYQNRDMNVLGMLSSMRIERTLKEADSMISGTFSQKATMQQHPKDIFTIGYSRESLYSLVVAALS